MSENVKNEENSLFLLSDQNTGATQEVLERFANYSLNRQNRNMKGYTREELRPVASFIAFIEEIKKKINTLNEEFTEKTGITLQQRRLKNFPTEKEEEEFDIFVLKMSALILEAKTNPFLAKDLQVAYNKLVIEHRNITPKNQRYLNGSLRNIFLRGNIERYTLPVGCLHRICFQDSTIQRLATLLDSFTKCGLIILPSDTLLEIFTKMEEILGGLLIPLKLILAKTFVGNISLEDLFERFSMMKKNLDHHIQKCTYLKKSKVARDFVATEEGIYTIPNAANAASTTLSKKKASMKQKRELICFRRMLRNTIKTLFQIEKNILIDSRKCFSQEMQNPDFGHIARDFQFICDFFQKQKRITPTGTKNTLQEAKNDQNFEVSSLKKEVQELKKENLFLKLFNEDLLQEDKLKKEVISDLNEKLDAFYALLHQKKKKTTLLLKLANQTLLKEIQEKIAQRLKIEDTYSQLLENFDSIPPHQLTQTNLKKLQGLVREDSPNEEISFLNLRKKTLEFYLNSIKNENLSLEAEITKLQYFTEEKIPESLPQEEPILIESLPKKEDLFLVEEKFYARQIQEPLAITPEDAMKEPWFRDLIKKYEALNEKTVQVNKITLDILQKKRSLEEEVREFKRKEKENEKVIEDLKAELSQTKASKECLKVFSSNN